MLMSVSRSADSMRNLEINALRDGLFGVRANLAAALGFYLNRCMGSLVLASRIAFNGFDE
jgi:uncharacterized membrane protein